MNNDTQSNNSSQNSQKVTLNGWATFDLYSLANTDSHFWDLIQDDMNERLKNKMVIFTSLFSSPDHDDFEETDEFIRIRHAPTALQLLRDFGHSLRQLTVELVEKNGDWPTTKAVFQLIQEKCTDSLEQLHLKRLGKYFFLNTTTPFKSVTNLSLTSEVTAIGNERYNLSDLFPALRNLHLSYVNAWNLNRLTVNYPHLKHLHIDVYQFDIPEFVTERESIELIKKNAHIQSLSLRRVQPNLLKTVAENVKNLQKFELYEYDEADNQTNHFHFDSVKSFKMSENVVRSMPANITFANLDEFVVQAYPKDSRYISFVEKHKSLKRFSVIGYYGLKNEEILRLAAANLTLDDISIVTDMDVKADSIVELIKSGKQLKQVHLNIRASDATIFGTIWALRKHFDSKWQINVHKNVVHLEQKNFNIN